MYTFHDVHVTIASRYMHRSRVHGRATEREGSHNLVLGLLEQARMAISGLAVCGPQQRSTCCNLVRRWRVYFASSIQRNTVFTCLSCTLIKFHSWIGVIPLRDPANVVSGALCSRPCLTAAWEATWFWSWRYHRSVMQCCRDMEMRYIAIKSRFISRNAMHNARLIFSPFFPWSMEKSREAWTIYFPEENFFLATTVIWSQMYTVLVQA